MDIFFPLFCIRFLQTNREDPNLVPRSLKFSMLNSAEHEILNAHKYINIKHFSIFSGSYKPRMLFSPLINVKMPTVVGILTFISGKNFMLS